MEKTTIQLKVTIRRETRTVEFFYFGNDDSRAWSTEDVALCQTTGKVWPCNLRAYKQEDGSYKIAMTDVRLNKTYPVVAWNDEKYTDRSLHNSA